MAKYLKTVGVIEIVSTIIGLIAFIIQSVMSFTNFFEFIISFVAIAFFAPSLGIALYVLGDLKEKVDYESTKNYYRIDKPQFSNTNRKYNPPKPVHQWRCKSCGSMISDDICPICEEYVKIHDPEYYEQIKKEYSQDKKLFNQYINERYELLKETL